MAQIQLERRMIESERHEKIMDFIRKCPRQKNKADVMRFMADNGASEPTTFKDLTYLIGRGRIIVLKDKPNSQTHYLIVNDEDEFNSIKQELSEMEPIINEMAEPWVRTHQIREKLYGSGPRLFTPDQLKKELANPDSTNTNEAKNPDLNNLLNCFLFPYREAFIEMLEVLWERVSKATISETDSQFLQIRINKLMSQLKFQGYPITQRISYLDYTIYELKSLPTSAKIYAKKNGISTKAQKNIISKIQDFEKQFLITQLKQVDIQSKSKSK